MDTRNLKLFTISVVMLFLEVFLIRLVSTEIRVFAYVSNLVLLACFLGIGVGSIYARKTCHMLLSFAMLTLVAVAIQAPAFRTITAMLSGFSDSVIWYSASHNDLLLAVRGVGLTIVLFAMIGAVFVPLGQVLGRLLDSHPRIIVGYSINIVGSLVGVWAFNLCSFFFTPPWLWFSIGLGLLLFFVPRRASSFAVALAAAATILFVTIRPTLSSDVLWSPYQKLEVRPATMAGLPVGASLMVNNVGFMGLIDLSEDFIARHPRLYPATMVRFNQYELPYEFKDSVQSVMILGAGGGNDVAAALRRGVSVIDAVEIDPGIVRFGRALHPEGPYSDPRVNLVVDDGRAFLKRTRSTYDLVSFGLLDAHSQSSSLNNTRLDHYIYTLESFREAKNVLAPDGVMSVSFSAQRWWIADRIYAMLTEVFGEVPFVFGASTTTDQFRWATGLFITGNDPAKVKAWATADPELMDYVTPRLVECGTEVRPTTDDWPYLYIESPSIPKMHLFINGALALLFISSATVLGREERRSFSAHFFFLGAAFLLLEFQNVSKASLLFGSTWMVTSYIISAIMVLILLANLFVHFRDPRDVRPYYALLFLSAVVLYLVPLEVFNAFGYWTKALVVAGLLNLPIFFAGVIFIYSFKRAPHKDAALGSNLLGAALGGLLESLSFITGVKALLLVVVLLYGLSMLFLRRATEAPVAAAE